MLTLLVNAPKSGTVDWRSASYDLRNRGIFSSLLLHHPSSWLRWGLLGLYGEPLRLVCPETYSPVDNAYATGAMLPNLSAGSPRCRLLSLASSDHPSSPTRIVNSSLPVSDGRPFRPRSRVRPRRLPPKRRRGFPRSATRLSHTGFWVALRAYSALWCSAD